VIGGDEAGHKNELKSRRRNREVCCADQPAANGGLR
jgi:hypothetical protein